MVYAEALDKKNSRNYIMWQLASLPFTAFLDKFIFRVKADYPKSLKIPNGVFIVSNHQYNYDPYLIYYYIKKINRGSKNEIEIRFPATHKYMGRRCWAIFLSLFGVYDIGATAKDRARGLLYTRHLLQQGISVLLFPEGKIVKKNEEIPDFKKGTEMIFRDKFPVVLVRLEGMNTFGWLNITKRHQVKIYISHIIDGDVSYQEKQVLAERFLKKQGKS